MRKFNKVIKTVFEREIEMELDKNKLQAKRLIIKHADVDDGEAIPAVIQGMQDDKEAFIKSAKKALATRSEIPSVVTIQKRKPSQDVGDLEE